MISVREVNGNAGVLGILRGRYEIHSTVSEPQLTVRRLPNGELNIHSLATTGESDRKRDAEENGTTNTSAHDSEEQSQTETSGTSFDTGTLFGSMQVRSGSITVVGPNEDQTQITELKVDAKRTEKGNPARLKLSFQSDSGKGGSVEGSGKINLDTLQDRSLDLSLKEISLSSFSPAVELLTEAHDLRGQLDGTVSLSESSAIQSSGTLTLTDFHVEGFGEPIQLPELSLRQEISMKQPDSGTFSFDLKSSNALQLSANGTLQDLRSDGGTADAEWTLKSDLEKLSHQIPSLLNLKTGWRMGGDLSMKGKVNLGRTTKEDKPGLEGTFKLKANGSSVRSITPGGETISAGDPSVQSMVGVRFQNNAGEEETDSKTGRPSYQLESARVRDLSVNLPGLSARASGSVSELTGTPQARDLTATASLNLEILRRKLAPFTDFGGYNMNGKLSMEMNGSGTEQLNLSGSITSEDVMITPPDAKKIGPLNVELHHKSMVDVKNQQIRMDQFRVASKDGSVFQLENGRLEGFAGRDVSARASWKGTLRLESLTKKLEPVLAPMLQRAFNRPDVQFVAGTLKLPEEKGSLRLEPGNPGYRLDVKSDLTGEKIALVETDDDRHSLGTRIKATADVSVETDPQKIEAREVRIKADGLDVEMSNTVVHPARSPGQLDGLSATFNAQLANVQEMSRIYRYESGYQADGQVKGTISISGSDRPPGQYQANLNCTLDEVSIDGIFDGSTGPFNGRMKVSDSVVDTRQNKKGRISGMTFKSDLLDLTGDGSFRLSTPEGGPSADLQLEGTINDPAAATKKLKPFLFGSRFSGSPVSFSTVVELSGTQFALDSMTTSARTLKVGYKPMGGGPVELTDVRGTGFISYGDGIWTFKGTSLSSNLGSVTADGTFEMWGKKKPMKASLETKIKMSLTALSTAFPGFLPGDVPSGQVNGTVSMEGPSGHFNLDGQMTASNVSYVPSGAEKPQIKNQQFSFSANTNMDFDGGFNRATIDSATLKADFAQLETGKGFVNVENDTFSWSEWSSKMEYHPKKMSEVFSYWMPSKLEIKDTKQRTAKFTLQNGKASRSEWIDALRGTGSYELGSFTWRNQDLKGGGKITLKNGRATIDYDLAAGDGTLRGDLQVGLSQKKSSDGSESPGYRFRMEGRKVPVKQKTSDFLGTFHPIFESVSGKTTGTVSLSLDGHTSTASQSTGMLEQLTGEGWISAKKIGLRAESFAGKVLSLLEQKKQWTADIPRISLKMKNGKVHYSDLAIDLSDYRVVTSGWVAPDGAFQMDVKIPVTDRLKKKYPQLKSVNVNHLTIPVHRKNGTISMDLKKAVQNVVKQGLEDRAKKELDDALDGLFD